MYAAPSSSTRFTISDWWTQPHDAAQHDEGDNPDGDDVQPPLVPLADASKQDPGEQEATAIVTYMSGSRMWTSV